jgi:hypothetical protein
MSNYVIITQEPRGVTSRKTSRYRDLFQSLEETRRKSQLAYVEKAVIREVLRDGTIGPVIAQFVKGKNLKGE